MTPAKTTVAVSSASGTRVTRTLRPIEMKPVRSATPIPIMTVSTGPRGANSMKLSTAESSIQRTPSKDMRLFTESSTTSPVRWTTSALMPAKMPEATTTMAAITANRVSGSGSR